MERVFVPANPGLLSAGGMPLADVVKDASRTVMRDAADADPAELDALFAGMERRGLDALHAEGVDPKTAVFERALDTRHKGQSFELTIPWTAEPVAAFEVRHEQRYGHRNPQARGDRQPPPAQPVPPPPSRRNAPRSGSRTAPHPIPAIRQTPPPATPFSLDPPPHMG